MELRRPEQRAISVGVPPVSGEQRAEFAGHVKKLGEEVIVAVRSIRQDAQKQQITARGRDSERAVQGATNATNEERLMKVKVAEVEG